MRTALNRHPGGRAPAPDRGRGPSVLRRAAAALAVTLAATVVPGGAAFAADPPAECVAATPDGPVVVTADCVDPLYASPVVDAQTDETSPVAHRKVTGHFDGTDIRFAIYLPPHEEWEGRFFQYTYPLTDENATDRAIAFGSASGAYTVQAGNDGVSLGYRHAAAAAKFARTVAADYYGVPASDIPGYLYGASGGSFQTIGAMENTTDVWQGFVPLVMGTPMSAPYTFFIRSMADLVLGDKLEQIADAVRHGGSGDPYVGLDEAERTMLDELTAFGVPLQGWEYPEYLLGRPRPTPRTSSWSSATSSSSSTRPTPTTSGPSRATSARSSRRSVTWSEQLSPRRATPRTTGGTSRSGRITGTRCLQRARGTTASTSSVARTASRSTRRGRSWSVR